MRLKQFYPICFVDRDVLLMYKFGTLYLYNIRTEAIINKHKVFQSFKESKLSRVAIISRLLRLGVRGGIYLGNNIAIICIGKKLYEIDTVSLEASIDYTNGYSRPLKMFYSSGVNGFDDGLYWGDYLVNMDKSPVSIHKRISSGNWETVYTFPQGEVNHIHAVVPDPFRDCFWIFTGDFGDSAAIWKATNNFKIVEPVARGNQLYRGCVVFPTTEGVLYATDAPYAQNYIVLMIVDNNTYSFKRIQSINGSCIYGTQLNDDNLVIQTSVEGDATKRGRFNYFDRTKGMGIKDYFCYLYVGNLRDGFKIKYRAEKDCLPFLFQFGSFMFPAGINKGSYLPFYSMAVKKHNLETQVLDLSE